MKPKDFKTLYTWEERRVHIHDGVLHIPTCLPSYEDFAFPGWKTVFQNQNPVNVEFCSGNGMWIVEKAQEFPNINWVAVDLDFGRIRMIWAKKKNLNLDNLFIVFGDANIAAKHYFPKNSVENVFINFPDPWPKTAHAKNRLMKNEFMEDVLEVMMDGALFTLVTDDTDYSERAIKVLTQFDCLKSLFENSYFTLELPGYGSSYFEELWRSKGKSIRYHQFEKQPLK